MQVQIPDNAVVLNELHLVEYLDPLDDAIKTVDRSRCSDGDDLSTGKRFEMAMRAIAHEVALQALDLMAEYAAEQDDDEEGLGV